MIRCKDVQNQLTAWLDGELEEQLQNTIKLHLEGCPSCVETMRLQQRERRWLDLHNRELEPRPELWHRIQRSLQEEAANRKPSWTEHGWTWLFPKPLRNMNAILAGTALMALLAIAGFWLFNPAGTAPNPASDQQVRQLMENYVQWRQSQKLFELPGINAPATNIDELRMANPFFEEKNSKADSNPFES